MQLGPNEWRPSAGRTSGDWRTHVVDAVSSSARTFRVALARHRRLRWLLTAAAAGCAAWSFAAAIGEAAEARDSWGETAEVWVADGSFRAGDTISVEPRRHPIAVLPTGALTSRPDPGAVALAPVGDGQVIVEADLAPVLGPAALAPPGSLVVAVADPLVAVVEPGTAVVIAAEGVVLASDGVVTASADGVTHVAVDASDAPMVAAAAHQHLATVLIPAPDRAGHD